MFERIVDPKLLVRKINITAINTISAYEKQPTLFDEENIELQEKEDSLQATRLQIMKKYGKNALLKGMNLTEGATTIDRNSQIGGHKA